MAGGPLRRGGSRLCGVSRHSGHPMKRPASGVWPRAGHEKTAPDQPTQTLYTRGRAAFG
jgi:hypothetical protein